MSPASKLSGSNQEAVSVDVGASGAASSAEIVLVRATRAELPGAALRIAGLSVVERLLEQLDRAGVRVIVLADGAVELPSSPSHAAPRAEEVFIPTGATVASTLESLRARHGEAIGADAPRDAPSLGGDAFCLRVSAATLASWRAGNLEGTTRISDEATRRRCEDLVFADLLRGDLGFIARHVNKKLSFRITRYVLCRLPVTPNQVTIGSALVGLAGCGLVATGRPVATALGMVAAQLQSVLDGCDGELARVRFQQSAIGEWLDSLMDDGLNLALVLAITSGLERNGWGTATLLFGGITAGMFLFYNLVSYRQLLRQGLGGELLKIRWKLNGGRDMKAVWATPGAIGPVRRLLLTLGRRDTFVFAWMLLALLWPLARLMPVVLLWAFLVAAPCFVTAVAELVLPDAPSSNA